MKILLLSSSHKNKTTKKIKREVEKRGHQVDVLDPLKLCLYVSSSQSGYDKILDTYHKELKRVNDRGYDAVISRVTKIKHSSIIVDYFHNNLGLYTTATANSLRLANDKFQTTLKASMFGIKVPKTILFNSSEHINTLAEKVNGFPLILKTQTGSQGKGVSLIKDINTLVSVTQTFLKREPNLILQEYINSNNDYRAIVIGDKVVTAMIRTSSKRGEFRTNISIGGKGEKVELSDEDKEFCVRAAKSIGLDFCGVDFMKKNNENYLIEINSNMGFKIEEITGFNIAKALTKHIEQQVLLKQKNLNKLENCKPLKKQKNTRRYMFLKRNIKILEDKLSFYENNKPINNIYKPILS